MPNEVNAGANVESCLSDLMKHLYADSTSKTKLINTEVLVGQLILTDLSRAYNIYRFAIGTEHDLNSVYRHRRIHS